MHLSSPKLCVPVLAVALSLTACANPFGASTDSNGNSKSANAKAATSSSASASASSSSPSGSTSSSASASTGSEPSPSVVTVTASPEPSPSTVTVTAEASSSSASSRGNETFGSGREALNANISQLRGGNGWDAGSADTSNYSASAELSWITVGTDSDINSPHHIMLFRYGKYLGTATYDPISGKPDVSRTSGNQIEAKNSSGGNLGRASFTWDSGQQKIVMRGDLA